MKDGKTTKSEAGRLGWERSRLAREEASRIRRERYGVKPSMCGLCGDKLPYENRHHKFCSQSCAAKKNNDGVRRHGSAPGNCLVCGNRLDKSCRVFCSNGCQKEFNYHEFVRMWLAGEKDGITCHGMNVSGHIRRWLKERCGGKCQVCGGDRWMGNPMPLTVDHVDGSYKNNRPENLRMVCCNCGMLLPTFAGRNRGNGRMARKQWDDKLIAVMKA